MADIDSKLPVQDAADGTDGATAPSIAQQVGGIDGSGNLQAISVDTSGKVNTVTKLVDASGNNITVKQLSNQVAVGDYGLVTNAVIHGLTTAGGGSYVDVKVSPSGALTVESTVTSSALPTGAATEATLSTLNGKIPSNLTVTSTRLLVDGSGVTQPVSQSGSWTTGRTWALSSSTDSIDAVNLLTGTGAQGSLTVGTSAVLVNVSGSNRSGRKNVTLYNNSLVNMYWGYDSGVTTSTGTILAPTQMMTWDASSTANIYVIAGSSNNNARVTEGV